MRHLFASAVALAAAVLAPGLAHADDLVGVSGTASSRSSQLAVLADGVPMGTFHLDGRVEGDLEPAAGIGFRLETDATDNISVGVAPRAVFGLHGDAGDGSSVTELDLRLRFGVHAYVLPRIEAAVIFMPGLSALLRDGEAGAVGPTLAVGAAVNVDLTPVWFATAEASYQWGFQGASGDDVDLDLLNVGLGIGTRF